MIKKLLLFIVAAVLSSCASSGPGVGVKAPSVTPKYTVFLKGEPEWKTMEDVKKDLKGSGAKIIGTTVDLAGGKISGAKLKHSANQNDEQSIGVKVRIDGFTLKRGMLEDLPGGIIVYAEDVTFEDLIVLKIGEDGLSNGRDVSPNTRIINCKLYGTAQNDKGIQLNDGRGAEIKNCFISGGITGARIQKKAAAKQNGTATVTGNTFKNVDTAINCAGEVTVIFKNNKFEGVNTEAKVDGDGVKIIR
jgi:hypothetical protein